MSIRRPGYGLVKLAVVANCGATGGTWRECEWFESPSLLLFIVVPEWVWRPGTLHTLLWWKRLFLEWNLCVSVC